MEERLWWLALSLVPGVGKRRFMQLIERFQNPGEIFSAPLRDLTSVPGITEELAEEIRSFDRENALEKELGLIKEHQVTLLTRKDKGYPKNLNFIFDPPPVLYIRGEWREEDEQSIAIVGTRHPTRYGKLAAETLAGDLALRGFTVVSGMARGIDTFAHEGALSGGGRTVAVFGSGIDVVYPAENRKLMEKIIENGAVISEFPMGTIPDRKNFPVRNRIISGLSLGTVVVEAAAKSGSLITAREALEQGREVFSVPGNISSDKSKGTNNLLKWGARMVESVDDILEELTFCTASAPEKKRDISAVGEKGQKPSGDGLTEEEREIFLLIREEGIHIDSIIEETSVLPHKAMSILAKLELMGLIRQYSGKMFYREK